VSSSPVRPCQSSADRFSLPLIGSRPSSKNVRYLRQIIAMRLRSYSLVGRLVLARSVI
jgi:hypothetical protein